jgi:hypothetical protein
MRQRAVSHRLSARLPRMARSGFGRGDSIRAPFATTDSSLGLGDRRSRSPIDGSRVAFKKKGEILLTRDCELGHLHPVSSRKIYSIGLESPGGSASPGTRSPCK